MNKNNFDILIVGVGGQGVLLASEIISEVAMAAGLDVKKSEVHGMSQRGGSVESHVRFGKRVYSPLVPMGCADVLVCFHPEELPRLQPFLKKEGLDLSRYVEKATQAMADNPRGLNTCLVGVLSAKLPIKEEHWMKAIETVFKGKGVEENKEVFLDGRKLGQS
jgi:indolepyruvate ferredoxin oxidoreductase beta subunit